MGVYSRQGVEKSLQGVTLGEFEAHSPVPPTVPHAPFTLDFRLSRFLTFPLSLFTCRIDFFPPCRRVANTFSRHCGWPSPSHPGSRFTNLSAHLSQRFLFLFLFALNTSLLSASLISSGTVVGSKYLSAWPFLGSVLATFGSKIFPSSLLVLGLSPESDLSKIWPIRSPVANLHVSPPLMRVQSQIFTSCLIPRHRLNMLFMWAPCAQLYSLAETPHPPPPHLGSYTRASLVSEDRRLLFVTPCTLTYLLFVELQEYLVFLVVKISPVWFSTAGALPTYCLATLLGGLRFLANTKTKILIFSFEILFSCFFFYFYFSARVCFCFSGTVSSWAAGIASTVAICHRLPGFFRLFACCTVIMVSYGQSTHQKI
jgi:hypothetical protein